MTDYKEVSTTQHEQGSEQRVFTFKATQVIWLLLGLLEVGLALRFVFKLIGVNAANPFATLLYNVTNLFVAPFASLTGAPAAAGMVLEVSTLIAMIVYLLIGWALERIVYVLFYRPRGTVSVRQTSVAEHTPVQAASGVSQTTTTQTPAGTSQTTVTEHTNTQTPGSL
jgi:hypothetical protein